MIRHVTTHQQGHPGVAVGLMRTYYLQARLLLQDLFDIQHINVIHAQLSSPFFHITIPTFSQLHVRGRHCSPWQFDPPWPWIFTSSIYEIRTNSVPTERLRRLAWVVLVC